MSSDYDSRILDGELATWMKINQTRTDHVFGCNCPIAKKRREIAAALSSLSKKLKQLDQLKKKEEPRRLLGVDPPCKQVITITTNPKF